MLMKYFKVKSLLIIAGVLGFFACNEVTEKLIPSKKSSSVNVEASANDELVDGESDESYPTLEEVELSLLLTGAEEEPLPDDFEPKYEGFSQIKHFYKPETDEYFYAYEFPSVSEVDPSKNSFCHSIWYSDGQNMGACANNGNECRSYIGKKNGKRQTIIICCPDPE